MKQVKIQGTTIRLGDLLKFAGLASTGGEAKLLILEGQVQVNGEVCTQRGRQLRAGDQVSLNGQSLEVTT